MNGPWGQDLTRKWDEFISLEGCSLCRHRLRHPSSREIGSDCVSIKWRGGKGSRKGAEGRELKFEVLYCVRLRPIAATLFICCEAMREAPCYLSGCRFRSAFVSASFSFILVSIQSSFHRSIESRFILQ